MFALAPAPVNLGLPPLRASSVRLARRPRTDVQCKSEGGSGSNGGSKGGKGRKARRPGLFEVEIVTPPPISLGVHTLPENTHNGDQIEVDGEEYVVSSVVLQYKLVKGKYQRDHNRLEVQRLSRYLTNLYLEHMMKGAGASSRPHGL